MENIRRLTDACINEVEENLLKDLRIAEESFARGYDIFEDTKVAGGIK